MDVCPRFSVLVCCPTKCPNGSIVQKLNF
jgi:hypothetical protein